jgi:hypothetical protein
MRSKHSKPVLPPRLTWAFALLAALLLLTPSVAVYAQGPVEREELREKLSTDCANFLTNYDARVEAMLQERAARLQERAAREAEMDASRAEREAESRRRLAERMATLSENATTPAQVAAITAFTTTVEAAIATRTEAIDAAVSAFRTSAHEAASSTMVQADEAGDRFKAAVSAAFAEALAACDAGVSPGDIGAALRENIEAAKAEFETARAALPDVRAVVEGSLRPILESAVAQAVAEFEATVEAAAEELKAAFGPG